MLTHYECRGSGIWIPVERADIDEAPPEATHVCDGCYQFGKLGYIGEKTVIELVQFPQPMETA